MLMKREIYNKLLDWDITDTLLSLADPRQALILRRFFKTGPGEYGEGDQFIGLKNPQVRLVVKEAWKYTPLDEAAKLVKSPLHEVRLCGLLIMVEKYLKAIKTKDRDASKEIYQTYLGLHPFINNWDLVDLSAIKIVGNHEAAIKSEAVMTSGEVSRQLKSRVTKISDTPHSEMDEWIKPGNTLWQQRIAMVSTWMLIRKGFPEIAFDRAAYLLDSPHDLLHKAAGWMLREAWKHGYKAELRDFLQTHVKSMPAIMLSYACEQMPIDERHRWQQLRKS